MVKVHINYGQGGKVLFLSKTFHLKVITHSHLLLMELVNFETFEDSSLHLQ